MRIELLKNGEVYNTIICADLATAQALFDSDCREAAEQDAPPPAKRILTHLEFRRRFTPQEQELCDELEVTFESSPDLTAQQKRALRTGYKNFYVATSVDLDDPDVQPMLDLYVSLGHLTANRPMEILG